MTGLGVLLFSDHQYRDAIHQANARVLTHESADTRNRMQDALTTHLHAVEDLQAFMLASVSLPDNETFDRYAAGILDHSPTIRGLAYIDMHRIVRYFYPLKGNEAAIGLDLTTRPAAPFVEKAIRERRTTVNDPTVNVMGSLAVTPRTPLFRGDQLLGLVEVVFDVSAILQEASTEADPRFAVQLSDARGNRYWGEETISGETQTRYIQVGDNDWTLTVGWKSLPPGPAPFTLVLIWGVGGALLLSLLFITNRTWTQTEWLQATISKRTAELRESEARFRNLTEMSSDFYWESDAEHRLIKRGSANSTVSIFERGAQIGERRWEIPYLSPDEASWRAHRAVLDAHLPFRNFEFSRLGADGAKRHISISGDPVFDASGAFKGYRGVGSDITERTQALEATCQLTKRLTTTLESITDAFFTLDREWRFTYVNREAERLLGRTRGELTGRDLWTEFPDAIGSTFEREYRRAMADNKTVGFEEFYPPLNTWFSVRAYPSDQGLAVYFRDVTETKRTAEEIKFKNTILQTQQETSLDAILVVDENEQIISHNQQFVDLWRLSPQLVSARVDGPVLQSVVDQVGNSEAFLHRIQYLNEHRDDKSREEILLKDGRTIDRYSAPVVGENRKYYGRVWYFRDITEGKHTEERLQKLSNAIERSPAATVITDPHGRIEYVNPKFREITGYAPEELIGKTTALIKSGLTLPDVYEDLWRTILSGREWRGEMQNRKKNGELYWEYEIISSVKNEHGEIINFIAVKENITERKRAEEATRESQARLQQVIASAPGVIYSLTPGFVATWVSDNVETVLGYSVAECMSPSWWVDHLHPDDRPRVLAEAPRLFERAQVIHQYRFCFKNGLYHWIHDDQRLLRDPQGTPLEIVGAWSDITEIKLAAEALQQQHVKLLEAERQVHNAHELLAKADRLESVGRLAAGVAHEVKNPLTIIRLGTDYLAKQLSQGSNQEVLDDVRAAIDRADYVIRDLLDFSRQKPIDRRLTSIDEVIGNAAHFIKHELERRNIAIIRNSDDPIPPIYADPERLVQVFINLLSNAAQAIGRDGSIEIVERSIRVSERDLEQSETSVFRIGEPVITVDIRDNGPGISAEHEKKLFEPFFTTKQVGEGSGLGLAVSRNIVIMHGGSIRIFNRPEGGASALLMFRVAREHFTNEKENTDS